MGNVLARLTGSGQQKRDRSEMEDRHSSSLDDATKENTVEISIQDRRRAALRKSRGLRINTALTHGDGLSSEKATPAQLNSEPITPGRSPSQPSSHPFLSFKRRLDIARAKSEAEFWSAGFCSDNPSKSDSPSESKFVNNALPTEASPEESIGFAFDDTFHPNCKQDGMYSSEFSPLTPEGPPRKRMKRSFDANHFSTTMQSQLPASGRDDWFWSREENRGLLASKSGNRLRHREQQILFRGDAGYPDSDGDISDIDQLSPKGSPGRSSSGTICANYHSSHGSLQDSSPVSSLVLPSPALMDSPRRSGVMIKREVIDLKQSDDAEGIQSAKEEAMVFIAGNDRYALWREVQVGGAREAPIWIV